eukprot:4018278-Alexandrium_andersonii.AAC.1
MEKCRRKLRSGPPKVPRYPVLPTGPSRFNRPRSHDDIRAGRQHSCDFAAQVKRRRRVALGPRLLKQVRKEDR